MLITLCVAATASAWAVLVEPAALNGIDGALVVDVRPEADYLAARIPGALHVDVPSLSATREDGVANMLRPTADVGRELYAAGLDPARTTVIYGAFGKAEDLLDSARLFWILEALGWADVRVLDGGYPAWLEAELPTESGAPPAITPPANPPVAQLVRQRLATREDVETIRKEGGAALLDARGADYFEGTEQSKDVARPGHIPGAVNLPAGSFADFESPSFQSVEQIRELIEKKGLSLSTPTVTYCNTGRSASVAYLAARIAGMEHVAVYDGSMSEWAADESCEVELPDAAASEPAAATAP